MLLKKCVMAVMISVVACLGTPARRTRGARERTDVIVRA